MATFQRVFRWRRLLGLAWLIAWIITAPLFHVHIPDTTDRWSAIQSGGAHTVFSADLIGEYSAPIHHQNPDRRAHLSHRIVNSPELGIALFDEKAKKTKELHSLGASYDLTENQKFPSSAVKVSGSSNKPHHLTPFSASRAPPHRLCI